MNTPLRHPCALAVACLAALLALAGCGQRPDTSETSESARRSTGEEVRKDARETGAEVRKETREAATAVGEGARELGREARDAASQASTAVMGAAQRAGERIDDGQITAHVKTGLSVDKDLKALSIDVDTKDGVVTLMGTAPSAAAKSRAEEIARNVKDVKSVNNQLAVRG